MTESKTIFRQAEWLEAQPDNFFSADRNFRYMLERFWGAEGLRAHAKQLYKCGGEAVGARLVVLENAGNNLLSLSLFYLFAKNGGTEYNAPTGDAESIYQAVAMAAYAHRAYMVAKTYAQTRWMFGLPVMGLPVVQDLLAQMRAENAGILAGSFYIAHLMDKELLSAQENGFMKMALNLNKLRSAVLAREVIHRAVEVLGEDGTLEIFSMLPRLLQDNVVLAYRGGSPHVVLKQVQQDMRKHEVHIHFTDHIRGLLSALSEPKELIQQVVEALDGIVGEFDQVLGMDRLTAGIYMRPLMQRLTDLYYTVCMLMEAQFELAQKGDRSKQRLALVFFSHWVQGKEPKEMAYYDNLVARLAIE